MADEEMTEPTEPAVPSLPPDVQAQLDQIQAEAKEREDKAKADQEAEDSRLSALRDAKKVCEESCGPIGDLIAASTDDNERQALIDLQARTHAEHAGALEGAYQKFAGQTTADSNPAEPGETQITSTSASEGGATA